MKTFALFLLFASLPCCLGQTDTNLLATGDWSEPVSDGPDYALRGRLLVYEDGSPSAAHFARLYLELQNVRQGIWYDPIEVYFQSGWSNLHSEMHDKLDRPIPEETAGAFFGPPPKSFWVTLPSESTVRLRADNLQPFTGVIQHGSLSRPEGLAIMGEGFHCWIIPPKATNDFFLSATFTPPKDHPSPLNYHVWQGTLKLPKVKIPAKKP